MTTPAIGSVGVLVRLLLPLVDSFSQKYKRLSSFQRFWLLAFVLYRPCCRKSTNRLRSINGSSAWLLYLIEPAVLKVQITYEVSTSSPAVVCTLALTALLHGANDSAHPANSEFARLSHAVTKSDEKLNNPRRIDKIRKKEDSMYSR